MPTINELQDEIIEEFSALDDWMDRYALIIDLGNTLEPLPESDKTPTNIIEGCQSRVWITAHFDGERVHFQGGERCDHREGYRQPPATCPQ